VRATDARPRSRSRAAEPERRTIALGHAYGATGALLVVDALDELERRGGRYAAIAVSGAAGLGSAAIIER